MSKQRLPCIGLEIGLGHILCVISFLDIDMMTNLSIGIWNWIGVYLRPCLSSKVPKQGCPCIGLEIGFGHILRVISFLDIDMMASLSIGIWNWIGYIGGHAYVQRCRNRGFYVLDLKMDRVESYELFHF